MIGGLVGAGLLDEGLAEERLGEAAAEMPAYAKPWGDLGAKVRQSLERGRQHPWEPTDDADGSQLAEDEHSGNAEGKANGDAGADSLAESADDNSGNGFGKVWGGGTDRFDWNICVDDVLKQTDLRESIPVLAAVLIEAKTPPKAAIRIVETVMKQIPEDERVESWQAGYDSIKQTVTATYDHYGGDGGVKGMEPIDLWASFDPPPLPQGLLPKVIEDYALTLAETMGADPAGLAMAALTVCSAAITDDIKLQMKRHSTDWHECARLWSGLVGPPSAMKSSLLSATAKPLRRRDGELLRRYLFELKKHKELTPEERKAQEPPKQERHCLEDTTIEGAQEVMIGSPNGVLLYQDELSGFFGAMDKYSGGRGAAKDRGFWLQSWNGGPYGFNRIGRGAGIIPNLSVSMMGGVQTDVIKKIAAESYDDGFLQRMLLIMLRPPTMGKDAPAPPVAETYARLVDRLIELRPPREGFTNTDISLGFDPGAQALREEMERRHLALMQLETINKKLATHIQKYNGYFGRLCLLWHCIEHVASGALTLAPDVTEDTARRVADFMHRFILPHAVAFYAGALGLTDDYEHLASMAGFILANKLERVTRRDIARNGTLRKFDDRSTDAVLQQLEALGWLTPVEYAGTSKRTTRWLVNSKVHVLFAERAARETERRAAARELIAGMRGGE